MTDERAVINLGLKTGAGSSHGHGKSPVMTLDRLATASERTFSCIQAIHIIMPIQYTIEQ